jgi:hypothetical protein
VSFVSVAPGAVTAAASDLANLGSTISEANAAAAAQTTSVAAAAQDEVSTAIAAVFGSHAQQFQALSAKAAAFHDQFVHALTGGAVSYVEAEAANVLGLMVGAAASGAAAATPAANEGKFFAFIAALIAKAFAASTPAAAKFFANVGEKGDKLFSLFDNLVDADHRIAQAWGLVNRANQIQRMMDYGLKLIGQDGAELYTDGREVYAVGGNFPYLFPYAENWLYTWGRHIMDSWGWTDQTMQSIFRSEITTVFRGEGLVQHAVQKLGNTFFHIETDAEGQIISRIQVAEPEAREVLQNFENLSKLSEIQKDVDDAIYQAEQAATKLGEQALKEAQGFVEEAARQAALMK